MKATVEMIRERAREIVLARSDGVRFAQLRDEILQSYPETPRGTVEGTLMRLTSEVSDVLKPSRGLYVAANSAKAVTQKKPPTVPIGTQGEEDFYKPFAEWLTSEDEVTSAVALGGAVMKNKWGTPDVVGVYRSLKSHAIDFSPEIVTAEIKANPAFCRIRPGSRQS